MAKQSDEDYDKIMADLKARLDKIEAKPKPEPENGDYFWRCIVIGWLLAFVLCAGVIIFYS